MEGCRCICFVLYLAIVAPISWNNCDAADEYVSPEHEVPGRYFVEYPAAEQFCPPIPTTFQDAATTSRIIKGRRVNQHPNGGYGLALMKAAGRPLYHTGADLGWFRQGAPVFAIADGVVRHCQGAIRPKLAEAGIRVSSKTPIDYGNLIIIEHRDPEESYFCSIYAHLGNDRRVRTGDLVTAGQQIGTIGRKSGAINGGYEPHLHFGIRNGRWVEAGQELFKLVIDGESVTIRLIEPAEPRSRVSVEPDPQRDLEFPMLGRRVDLTPTDDGFSVPSFILYGSRPPDFGGRFAGYHFTLEGWRDPISFLRERRADRDPAPPYICTPFERNDAVGDLLTDPAPSWDVERWVQPAGTDTLDVGDFRGRVVCLFFVRSACRGSRSHALPALEQVARHFQGDEEVAVLVLQTPAGDRRLNTLENLERIAQQLPPEVPAGQCAKTQEPPAVVQAYQICGTPWTTIIDRDGIVQFNNHTVRPAEIIRRIEELK